MRTQSKTLETAKTLAVCIKLIKQEFSRIETLVEEKISRIPLQEDVDTSELKGQIYDDLVESLNIPQIDFGRTFDVLREEDQVLNKKIYDVNQVISKELELIGESFRKTERVNSEQHEQIETLNEPLESYVMAFQRDLSNEIATLNNKIKSVVDAHTQSKDAILSTIQGNTENISNIVEDNKQKTNKKLSDLDIPLEELQESINSKFDSINDYIEIYDIMLETQQEIDEQFEKSINTLVDSHTDLSLKFEFSKKDTEQKFTDNAKRFQAVIDLISNVERNKSHVDHEHDHYAHKDHNHHEYATQNTIRVLSSDIDSNKSKIQLIDTLMGRIEKELNTKINKHDALQRKDLDDLSVKIRDAVIEATPTPEDGKDGLGWEFKFHDTQRGILLYKRDDWDHWKSQNLLGPTQVVETGGGGYGGGGGVTVSDTSFFFNEEEIKNPLVRMAYAVESDENGYFELETNVYDHLQEVFDIEANAKMLDDNSLSPVERKVDVQIENIDTNGKITGYTFCNKAILSAPGQQQYALTEAPNVALIVSLLGK